MLCAKCKKPAGDVFCTDCIIFGGQRNALLASRKRVPDSFGTVAQLQQSIPEELSTAALMQTSRSQVVQTSGDCDTEPDWVTIAAQQVC